MINPMLTNEYEDEILNLIDNQDEFTRSDLQGIVTVLVNKIMESGFKIISNQKNTCSKKVRSQYPNYYLT